MIPIRPKKMTCSECGREAAILQRLSGRHLCGHHFALDIEQRVARTIQTRKMIDAGDRVGVALSGGKDSTALLIILSRILPAIPDLHLVAITIDEGIRGYREATLQAAEDLTRRLGVEHHCLSFSTLFGDTLDTWLKGREIEACSICGILRRKALAVGAREAGVTKLATGHNLDDEAQSVLMNLSRGDLPRLARKSSEGSAGMFIPRIKPLSGIPEKEIAAYLFIRNEWAVQPECPYAHYALRRTVRSLLSAVEYDQPGTMRRLTESKEKVENFCAGPGISAPLSFCRSCGDPCSGGYCQACRVLRSLGTQ